MKIAIFCFLFSILYVLPYTKLQAGDFRHSESHEANADSIALVEQLMHLASNEKNLLLKRHFESVLLMTRDRTHGIAFTEEDNKNAAGALAFFKGEGAKWETYLTEPRPLVMAFTSKIDGKNSYYWLFLPKNFKHGMNNEAFYLELHGSGGGSNNNPHKMLYMPFQEKPGGVSSQGYRRDGFMIYPWGRGDRGYRDTAEADIWECLADFDNMFTTDPNRQFMYGFSMGGAGTYQLSQKNLERWAAIGMYSGAARNATPEIAARYKHTPVWLAWGEQETRTAENNKVWRDMLQQAGVEVAWTEVKDTGHKYLGAYQEALMNWFLAHKKQ